MFQLLICSSVSSNLLLIPSSVFLNFDYCILPLCLVLLYISLCFVESLSVFTYSFPEFGEHLMIITLSTLFGWLVTFTSFSSFSEVMFLFLHLEHICLSPRFAQFSMFIPMC